MKKSFTKLVPALVMVLIAASMVGSSTYAWFSMNTTVDVTGMQIEVKSDDTYLLIGTGDNDTASEIQTAGTDTVALTVTDGDAKVYPCAPALTAGEAAYLTVAEGHNTVAGAAITTAGAQVTNAATAAVVTNWYTAKAAAVDDEAMLAGSAKQLTSFDGYVIRRTAYLTVAAGANNANNLRVSATITQKSTGNDVAATKIIVMTDDGGYAILDSAHTTADIKGSNNAITDAAVRTVNIYIYYDGNEEHVYTNNSANLTGTTISLTFDVDAVPAA